MDKLKALKESAEKIGENGEAMAAQKAIERLIGDHVKDEPIVRSKPISYADREFGNNWKRILMSAVCTLTRCVMYGVNGKALMRVYGTKDDVAVAEHRFNNLSHLGKWNAESAYEAWYKLQNYKGTSIPFTASVRRRYIKAYLSGYCRAISLNAGKPDDMPGTPSPVDSGHAVKAVPISDGLSDLTAYERDAAMSGFLYGTSLQVERSRR